MENLWIVLSIVIAYMALVALISYRARKSSRTAQSFATAGITFPASVIGIMFASELIGTTALIGTAQKGFTNGISAAWAVLAVAIGAILFCVLFGAKFKNLKEFTISGALARVYGQRVRSAVSLMMICALMIVLISTYASGGAVLAQLLGIDQNWAVVIIGVLGTLYVSVGGMKSVVYSNLLHAGVILVALTIMAVVGMKHVGGFEGLNAVLPPEMFSWDGVGLGQIGAWIFAGVGGMFGSQYVVQAISAAHSPTQARRSGYYAAAVLVSFAGLSVIVGMCSAVLHPNVASIQAMPVMLLELSPVFAGIAVAGLAAAMIGTSAAVTIGTSTLLHKDFYQRWFNKGKDAHLDLRFIRLATIAVGLLPIVLALGASEVLSITYLAKALRAALGVLVVLMFFAPKYGTRSGALLSIILALVGTIGWFLAGDPFGIDNAYVAVAIPIIVMPLSHLLDSRRRRSADLEDADRQEHSEPWNGQPEPEAAKTRPSR